MRSKQFRKSRLASNWSGNNISNMWCCYPGYWTPVIQRIRNEIQIVLLLWWKQLDYVYWYWRLRNGKVKSTKLRPKIYKLHKYGRISRPLQKRCPIRFTDFFLCRSKKRKNSLLRAVRLKSKFFFQIISVGILLHVNNLKQQLEKKVK